MNDMVKKLREYVGVPITLSFYIGRDSTSVFLNQNMIWTGVIINIGSDGLMEFEWIDAEQKRLKVVKSFLDLSEVIIWSFDEISDDSSETRQVTCPSCKEDVPIVFSLNRKSAEEKEEK